MGDMGDIYRERKEFFRERKKKIGKSNTETINSLLETYNCAMLKKNDGLHLIIILKNNNLKIDFYPTKSKWAVQDGKYRWRYGVDTLKKFLETRICKV